MQTHLLLLLALFQLLLYGDPPTAVLSPLSLHDALPILHEREARLVGPARRHRAHVAARGPADVVPEVPRRRVRQPLDRKSTRLNSSHVSTSYAVFCLKKKNANTRLFHLLFALRHCVGFF